MKSKLFRAAVSAALLVSCALAMSRAWRAGSARLLAADASRTLTKERAEQATERSPSDPETHSARAFVLYNSADLDGALRELERAATLRPRDYLTWLQLGRARDEAGETDRALQAFQEAVKLAPYYSAPRWQYGNVLYRAGRFDEAFRELRRAAESDPALLPVLMDLAWGTHQGDAGAVERIVDPQTDAHRLALASFFVQKGETGEALSLFRAAASGVSTEERNRLLTELLKARHFKAAYEVWSAGRGPGEAGGFTDPGFEERVSLSERGFGWRQERSFEGVRLSLETKGARSGSRCLLIEWSGHPDPGPSIISQLVLVEPGARYRLAFFARAEEVVTGGPPVLVVTDAGDDEARVLGQSEEFPRGAAGWQEYETVFTTPQTTEAVLVSVRRQRCPADPCPIFGRVWLDDFSLRRL